ncbi:MAG: hypothetical protein AAFY15_13285, partial [Cyanobacteria bacterium J06648_11]
MSRKLMRREIATHLTIANTSTRQGASVAIVPVGNYTLYANEGSNRWLDPHRSAPLPLVGTIIGLHSLWVSIFAVTFIS